MVNTIHLCSCPDQTNSWLSSRIHSTYLHLSTHIYSLGHNKYNIQYLPAAKIIILSTSAVDIRRLCQHVDEWWSEEKCVRFFSQKSKNKKCSFIWVVFIIALPLPTSKWNGRCWSLMAGSLLDPRVINNKTLLSVTGGSVVIQMTGIKRWFYLLGIRNISIINFHQQQQSVWREDLLLLPSAV